SRVIEKPCVYAEPIDIGCTDPEDWKKWQAGFDSRRKEVLSRIEAAQKLGADGLLRYLRRHPPNKFCFLHELVCCLREQDVATTDDDERGEEPRRVNAADWDRVRLLIYLDWYLHQFECECWSCRPDRGVPIARVMLQRLDGPAGRRC